MKINDDMMKCISCQVPFHSKCIGLSADFLEIFKKANQPGAAWFCKDCHAKFANGIQMPDMNEASSSSSGDINLQINLLKSMNERMKIMEDKIESVTPNNNLKTVEEVLCSKLAELGNEISSKVDLSGTDVQQKLKTYADCVSKKTIENSNQLKSIEKLNKNIEGLKMNLKDDKQNQMEERKLRLKQNNVCVFNVPESNEENFTAAYQDDMRKLQEILQTRVDIQKEDLKEVFRIGPKGKTTKPRPIIIKFTSTEKKFEVLKERELYFLSGDERIRIFITPDRTLKQQAEHKKLIEELKQRKQDGESNLVIRNGKIITLQMPFRLDPRSFWG